jgi:hypothetical protein
MVQEPILPRRSDVVQRLNVLSLLRLCNVGPRFRGDDERRMRGDDKSRSLAAGFTDRIVP